MMKIQGLLFSIFLLLTISISYAQNPSDQLSIDEDFWTLPSEQCRGDNFCEMRISPQGSLYAWDHDNQQLYISRKNQSVYETYDLSNAAHFGVSADFILFELENYVAFYAAFGYTSDRLLRYDLTTNSLQEISFPTGYRKVTCNEPSRRRQEEQKSIFQLGLEGNLLACAASPDNKLAFLILNIQTLQFEQIILTEGRFSASGRPQWETMGGLNNKIYVLNGRPFPIDTSSLNTLEQTIVFIYDVGNALWSHQILSHSHSPPPIFLGTAQPNGTLYIINYTLDQYASDSQLLRQIDQATLQGSTILGYFIGVTLDNDIFMRIAMDYSAESIVVIQVDDDPLSNPCLFQENDEAHQCDHNDQ